MANKRMFSKQIVETDAFLDMPKTSQLLYFHLNMEADDDGFVASPKKVMRIIGSGDDDIKILLAKRFLLAFDSGVVVIKHWLIHNYIRKDTYTATKYLKEKSTLEVNENGGYTERGRLVDGSSTQVRLDKVREDKKESSLSYLKEIPEQDLEEIYSRFDCDKKAIKNKAESLYLYCQSKGKVYKNYKAFLLNAIKKDYPERKEPVKSKKVVMIDGKPTIIG